MQQRAKWAVGIGAAVLAFAGMTALDPFGRRTMTPAQAEELAGKDPAFARYLDAFRETFPTEYAAFLKTTTDNYNAGMAQEQAQQIGFSQVARLVQSHRADMTRAPDAQLLAHVRAQHALLAGLDEAQCAKFFMTGPTPGEQLSEDEKLLVADFTAATMRTARAGIDHPVARPTTLAQADGEAVTAAMRKAGMTSAQDAAFTGGTLASAPAADQCAVGRYLTGAIGTMPPAQAGRTWSYTLSLS